MRKKIPHFESLEEESDFWDTADLTDYIDPNEPPIKLTVGGELAERLAARLGESISLRMDKPMLDALKKLARKRRMGYQTMMRAWVAERLEQELKRPAKPRTKAAAG
jgi:predicted DNA binding CopG/RHH family protein